ncbi:hypothetical protein HJG54_30765 [Leptolyngbya sp. NK1-12]|uniref:Uncharacterized protein n=1 Tax=Leptolyngbya sp. NK1-12 TaxID=2547451 RepID=A0AA96WM89_9CYAN|nr:hypothetical protein [Leptolyngbya sp. NK1-12]WNZ27275.1 hypothetical protein HJG54_30765 [Leptolyngbya sp. NK1-12]
MGNNLRTNLTTDEPTEEQMGWAYVFLDDLKTNKALNADWQTHLTNASDPKYGISDKVNYLDNFLADNGYNTTAEAVLSLLKTPWWNDYIASRKPNDQSDRFVQDLLQDSHLYREWAQIIQQSATGGNLDKADQFLKQNGYDCTAIQVNASFLKMRDKNLNFWTGTYGQTIVQPTSGGDAQPGPAVIVYGDSTVSVGPEKLFAFKYSQGTLTWTTDGGGGLETNSTSGSITFSQINRPKSEDSYVGCTFSGTITYPEGTNKNFSGIYTFNGKIGDPPPNQRGNVNHPPSVDTNTVDQLAKTLGPYIQIGFAISLLFGAGGALFKGGKWLKDKFSSEVKEKVDDAVETTKQELSEVPPDEFNNQSTTAKQLTEEMNNTSDPEKQKEIEEEIDQENEADEKSFEDEETDLTGEGETANTLDEALE